MAVPTRSQNSSWHSLWDLRGTQAPQLRQSNNTLGGFFIQEESDSSDDEAEWNRKLGRDWQISLSSDEELPDIRIFPVGASTNVAM